MAPDPKPPKRIVDPLAGYNKVLAEGHCRACGLPAGATRPDGTRVRLSRFHIVGRDLGGDDVDDNIIPVCGDGTTGCHGTWENNEFGWVEIAARIRLSFSQAELDYALGKKNPVWLDRYYPLGEA